MQRKKIEEARKISFLRKCRIEFVENKIKCKYLNVFFLNHKMKYLGTGNYRKLLALSKLFVKSPLSGSPKTV